MIVLYLLFIIVGIYFLGIHNKYNGFIGGYSGFIFGFLLYYTVVPILFIIYKNDIISDSSWAFYQINKYIYSHGFNSMNALYSFLVATIGFIFFQLGYSLTLSRKITLSDHNFLISNCVYRETNQVLIKIVNSLAIITFIISSISFLIFIYAIGGIRRMLSLAEILRQHYSVLFEYVNNPVAGLMIVPSALLPVSTLLFFYLILLRKKRQDKLLFIVSFFLSIFYLLYNAGRFPIIRFLIIFLYMFISRKRKRVWTKILLIGIAALPLLDILDSLFIYFHTNVWEVKEPNMLLYLRQFSQPIILQFNLREFTNIYGYRFFKDFVTDIVSLAPGIDFEKSYENTSEFVNGANWKILGGVQNDVLTYGYIQLGILGVIIFLFLCGIAIGFLDKILFKLPKSRSRDFLSVIVTVNMFQIVRSTDLYTLLKYNPILLVIFLILIIYSWKLKSINHLEQNKSLMTRSKIYYV